MSDIKLTPDLLEGVQKLIEEHEPEAVGNQVVTVQYLAAVVGLMTAQFPTSAEEKNDILDQLHGLARHVLGEQSKQSQQGRQPRAAAPEGWEERTGPATGVWHAGPRQ